MTPPLFTPVPARPDPVDFARGLLNCRPELRAFLDWNAVMRAAFPVYDPGYLRSPKSFVVIGDGAKVAFPLTSPSTLPA